MWRKKGLLFAALPRRADALPEKLLKELSGPFPVLPVDAIPHLGSLHLALYEAGLFQLFQVLGDRRLGDGQLFVNIAEVAGLLLGQEVHDGDAGRVSQRFGDAGQLLLGGGVLFFLVHSLFIVRKYTNIIRLVNHICGFFCWVSHFVPLREPGGDSRCFSLRSGG